MVHRAVVLRSGQQRRHRRRRKSSSFLRTRLPSDATRVSNDSHAGRRENHETSEPRAEATTWRRPPRLAVPRYSAHLLPTQVICHTFCKPNGPRLQVFCQVYSLTVRMLQRTHAKKGKGATSHVWTRHGGTQDDSAPSEPPRLLAGLSAARRVARVITLWRRGERGPRRPPPRVSRSPWLGLGLGLG